MLSVVPSALSAFELNARTVSSSARGAMPSIAPRDAMAPAMPVPCGWGFSSTLAASKLAVMAPARSGCDASTPESITATEIRLPVARRCALARSSFSGAY